MRIQDSEFALRKLGKPQVEFNQINLSSALREWIVSLGLYIRSTYGTGLVARSLMMLRHKSTVHIL